LSDRERWDKRYLEAGDTLLFGDQHAPLLSRVAHLIPTTGNAVDLGCGEGQNAIWLARHGLRVLGLDVSPVALSRARRLARARGVRLSVRVADLSTHTLRRGYYDVITCFHYLERRLIPIIEAALRPGGVVVIELATEKNLRLHARPGRDHVLREGELATWFPSLETLYYREGFMDGHEQAQIVARRPLLPAKGRRYNAR